MLKGQVAIVSGIGPGMGRDISLKLAEAGANIVLAARSEEKLLAVQAEVEQLGVKALSVVTDIGKTEDCQALVEQSVQTFGRIDTLVNNAYDIGDIQPFESMDIDEVWQRVLNINLLGYMRLSQAVVPQMKAQAKGSIVMISSVSMCDFQNRRLPVSAYASSKAGLQSASMYMAGELGKSGIRVNTVRPAYIDGETLQEFFEFQAAEEGISVEDYRQRVIDTELALNFIPHSRDIADSVLFFASNMSRAVTGATLDVNAGERIAMQ